MIFSVNSSLNTSDDDFSLNSSLNTVMMMMFFSEFISQYSDDDDVFQ